MAHELEPPEHYVPGDSIEFVYTVESDDISSLSGVTASWWLLPERPKSTHTSSDWDSNAEMTDSDTGITINIDQENMEIHVQISDGVTSDLSDNMYQILRAEGNDQGTQTWGGEFPVDKP